VKILTRRTFITGTSKAATGVCLCGIGGCATLSGVGDTPAVKPSAYSVSDHNITIQLDQVPELSRVGGSAKIVDEKLQQKIIIARVSEEDYITASISCTHMGTEVEYRHQDNRFQCASLGGSKYRLDGTVIGGPAEAPLALYGNSVNDNRLIIES